MERVAVLAIVAYVAANLLLVAQSTTGDDDRSRWSRVLFDAMPPAKKAFVTLLFAFAWMPWIASRYIIRWMTILTRAWKLTFTEDRPVQSDRERLRAEFTEHQRKQAEQFEEEQWEAVHRYEEHRRHMALQLEHKDLAAKDAGEE